MQDTIGELEKLDRLDKCSMATKTKTWTTQKERTSGLTHIQGQLQERDG